MPLICHKQMQNTGLLKLRIQWFKLKAKEFIARYAAGLMVIALALPGVAIGDNLNLILLAITQPLLYVSMLEPSFIQKLSWLMVLMVVFVVWARAQKTAINGGQFAQYTTSLPIPHRRSIATNFLMVLISNHFLWVFMIYGIYHITLVIHSPKIEVLRYFYLLALLISCQYVVVFSSKKLLINALIALIILAIALIIPISQSLEWLRLSLVNVALIYFVVNFLSFKRNIKHSSVQQKQRFKMPFHKNLYYQMLVSSDISSTMFRFGLLATLLFGFSLSAQHLSGLNENKLDPYAFIIEALLAFYLSGFYLIFKDQRKSMQQFLMTLPIRRFFWVQRDILTVILLSFLIHLPYLYWQIDHFENSIIVISWAFHLFLLLVSYPIRVFIKEGQTFITFAVILILTIILIYNKS